MIVPPWRDAHVMEPARFAEVRRRTIFECCKWDPQVEDVAALSPVSMVLPAVEWTGLAAMAERLAAEALAAERELIQRIDLHWRLGLPRGVRQALLIARSQQKRKREQRSHCRDVRVTRFDFHFTTDGWRISEANSDVPGGFIEASGFTQLMAEQCAGLTSSGDPAGVLVDAIAHASPRPGRVALVHATGYTDDRQVMIYLGRRLEQRGLESMLLAPDKLRWHDERCAAVGEPHTRNFDLIMRFYPGEWLPNLPQNCGWRNLFGQSAIGLCNPATALLTQSKCFPLVWDDLATPLPTWRELLPETRAVREVSWQREDWIVKPALGRVGEGVGMQGVTSEKEWKRIRRNIRWHPREWVAQRRFNAVPLVTKHGEFYPSLGVFVINGRAAGVYGRMAREPLIDYKAQDMAVLIDPCEQAPPLRVRKANLVHDAAAVV